MKSRHASLLLLVIMITSLLTGCMLSDEERAIKTEVENIAKPYIESFVQENYKEWTIDKLECILENKEDFKMCASEFVRVALTNKKQEGIIELIYNTENNDTFVKDEKQETLDKIADYLGVQKEFIRDITFNYKPLQEYNVFRINGSNYYKIGDTDLSEYKLNILVNCEKKQVVEDIKKSLNNLGNNIEIDYEIIVIQGYIESELRNTEYYMNNTTDCIIPSVSDRCKITVFKNKDKVKSEVTHEFRKLAIDSGYIIYNEAELSLEVKQKENRLGKEESINATSDTEIKISKKDATLESMNISIFSTESTHIVVESSDGVKTVSKLNKWSSKLFNTEELRQFVYINALSDTDTLLVSLITKQK